MPSWADGESTAYWAAADQHERAGHVVRIDHRSLEAQGVERLPGVHLGPTVQAMEARGIETERGTEARPRAQVNAERAQVTAELAELKSQQEAAQALLPLRGTLDALSKGPGPALRGSMLSSAGSASLS